MQNTFPQAYVLGQIGNLVSNFTRNGRSIEIAIENYTFQHFVLYDHYFDYGTMDKNPEESIRRGDKTEFSVCKKVGFYGVEGTVVYCANDFKRYFAFSFFNPISGGNSIVCKIYKSENGVK